MGDSVDDSYYWSTEQGREFSERTWQYVSDSGKPLDVSIWAWCWDIVSPGIYFSQSGDFTREHLSWYHVAISRFNTNIDQTKYVYHTSITDGVRDVEQAARVTQMNQLIREEAGINNGILFDQADIENWNNDNSERATVVYDNQTFFLRHPEYNDNGTNNPPSFRAGHTTDALCIRKAKALWVLLAKISGWDGATQPTDTTPPSMPGNVIADNITDSGVTEDETGTDTRINLIGSTDSINDTNWHQYVLTYDGSEATLYVDSPDNVIASATASNNINTLGHPLVIGKYPWAPETFDGQIDELEIHTMVEE